MFFDSKFAQRKLCQSYPVHTVTVYSKFNQSLYPKLPFDGKFKNKQNE